jgi:hypothetical protein
MEFLLQFTPEQVCFDCDAMTTLGIASNDDGYIRLEPLCPRHGYLGVPHVHTEQQTQEEAYTIKRFVLSQKDGQGEVTSVEKVPLDELETHGIEVFRGDKKLHYMADEAWRVDYQRDGVKQTYYVIWSDESLAFDDLYEA